MLRFSFSLIGSLLLLIAGTAMSEAGGIEAEILSRISELPKINKNVECPHSCSGRGFCAAVPTCRRVLFVDNLSVVEMENITFGEPVPALPDAEILVERKSFVNCSDLDFPHKQTIRISHSEVFKFRVSSEVTSEETKKVSAAIKPKIVEGVLGGVLGKLGIDFSSEFLSKMSQTDSFSSDTEERREHEIIEVFELKIRPMTVYTISIVSASTKVLPFNGEAKIDGYVAIRYISNGGYGTVAGDVWGVKRVKRLSEYFSGSFPSFLVTGRIEARGERKSLEYKISERKVSANDCK